MKLLVVITITMYDTLYPLYLHECSTCEVPQIRLEDEFKHLPFELWRFVIYIQEFDYEWDISTVPETFHVSCLDRQSVLYNVIFIS